MDAIMPWEELSAIIKPFYPQAFWHSLSWWVHPKRNVWIGVFFVTALGSVPPALVLGVVDVVARAIEQPLLRALVALLLILVL